MCRGAIGGIGLHEPRTYRIVVPGELDERSPNWAPGMEVTAGTEPNELSCTVLTGSVDQAALHSILRKLYALGIPLLSVALLDKPPQRP